MTGPKTVREHIVPTIRAAAEAAGRPDPRVVCILPVGVTDDVEAARARADEVFAVYGHLPSYRAMMDREGVAGPSGLSVIGDEDTVTPEYARNDARALNPEVLVVIGTCTHLGCLPKTRFTPGDATLAANWPGGFFCPCHGSKFDLAGRVFEGSPASVNLRIPPYSFKGDSQLVIGVDAQAEQGVA